MISISFVSDVCVLEDSYTFHTCTVDHTGKLGFNTQSAFE